MYTYEDIATEVSKLLNDSEHCDSQYNFTRWSKSDLIHYAKDAVGVIAASVPKKFVSIETVKLQPGSVQELPKDCSKIIKILNLADDVGASPCRQLMNTSAHSFQRRALGCFLIPIALILYH